MNQSSALFHLAWAKEGSMRYLIFGWLEIFPPGYPKQLGHKYVSMEKEPVPGTRIYVGRFPMTAEEAMTWYADAARGQTKMPAYLDEHTEADGKPLRCGIMEAEPPGALDECLAMGLPFLPAVHGGMHVQGLFGIPDQQVQNVALNQDALKWLEEHLYFSFTEYPEYLCSLFRVRHNPVIRSVEQHLSPRDEGTDDELIRIVTWPGASLDDCEILSVEQRPFGIAGVQRQTLSGPVHTIHWPHKIERTGIAIIHRTQGLCWWREPLPYVRAIKLNVTPLGRRRLIQLLGKDGTVRDRYEVAESLPSLATQSVIGEPNNPDAVLSRYYSARQLRDQRKLRASLGLRWFDDQEVAAKDVRALIEKAQQEVRIVDPYFVGEPLVRFAFAAPREVPVRILTSAKALRAKLEDRAHYAGERLKVLLDEAVKQNVHKNIQVSVMPGKEPPIHDRFLIIDGRLWLSGNSLNTIGDRPSVLVEVPDPEDIIEKLKVFEKAATPFDQWFAAYTPSQESWLRRLCRWYLERGSS